ncbi:O-antigen ligase family protein [Vibrio maritimus]|uniref:O-antigen ligase family protein n=1 Tax=Vibrio maritimus TaxID=990268 RepID=UPI003735CB5D
MNQVSKMSNIDKVWAFFLFLLVISIPTSKAGMNAASLILGLGTLTYLPLKLKSESQTLRTTFIVCCICFFVGLIGPVLVNNNLEDIKSFAQKNIYLLVIPIATYLFSKSSNSKVYAYAFVLACVAAAISSLTKLGSNTWIDFSRVTGFLDFSRHINSLLLGIALCVAFIDRRVLKSFTWLIPLMVLLSSIVISGTRGGWVAVVVMFTIAIILYHRFLLVPSILMTIVTLFAIHHFYPSYVDTLQHRVMSITDTKNDPSNSVRLTIWRSGVEYLSHNASDNKINLVVGSGMISTDHVYRDYMNTLPREQRESFYAEGGIVGGTDFHNGPIDVISKSGLLFFTLIFGAFVYFAGRSIRNRNDCDFANRAFLVYGTGFLILLPFYSLLQDYSVLTLSFIIPLALSDRIKKETTNEG